MRPIATMCSGLADDVGSNPMDTAPSTPSKSAASGRSISRKKHEYISAVRPPRSCPSSSSLVEASTKLTSVLWNSLILVESWKYSSTLAHNVERWMTILHGFVLAVLVGMNLRRISTYCRKAMKRAMKAVASRACCSPRKVSVARRAAAATSRSAAA